MSIESDCSCNLNPLYSDWSDSPITYREMSVLNCVKGHFFGGAVGGGDYSFCGNVSTFKSLTLV